MVMRESSRLLHQATDGRAFIRSVNVVLPASWTGDLSSSCRRNVSRTRLDSYSEADVKISSAPHPLFSGGADSLWTQQSRECGQSGDYISAGPDFFFRMDASDEVWIKGKNKKIVQREMWEYILTLNFVRESRVSRQVCGRALLIYRALNYQREGGLEIENFSGV